jgi:hypothetical protein
MAVPDSLVTKSLRRWLELFVLANIAFLGFDIALAHSANGFAHPAEWAPVVFSGAGSLLLVPGVLRPRRATWIVDVSVAAACVGVGVLGMAFHLASAFFVDRTLRALVYAAPFVAPLAYVGVGLLLLLLRVDPSNRHFGEWVLLLAIGGFIGNFALALLDHAQNAFFHGSEWIPVVAAAYAVGFFAVALASPRRAFVRACYLVCGVEAIVGMLGFVLHVVADSRRPARAIEERFIFGAPAFAPLLFANLAVLAAIGLWAIDQRPAGEQTAVAPRP